MTLLVHCREEGQTGVPLVDSVLPDAVTVADQDALPSFDQGQNGVFGTMGINTIVDDLTF